MGLMKKVYLLNNRMSIVEEIYLASLINKGREVYSKDILMCAGRGTVLTLNLDRFSDSVSSFTSVDPTGYLTAMLVYHWS